MFGPAAFDLGGRRALVTGGAEGLGAAIAAALAAAGAEVGIIDVRPSDATAPGNKPAFALQADLSQPEAVRSAADRALRRFDGRIDVLVNNAGHQFRAAAVDHGRAEWEATLSLNLTAAFLLSQHIAPGMIERGRGKIINLASIRSFVGSYGAVAYGVSKGGIAQLTRSLCNEWAPFGVQVNAIAPGFMRTALTDALQRDDDAVARSLSRIPAGRWGEAADVQGLAVFLASSASDYVNGAIIPCDGGFLAN
ncbi:2-deoxy-D-gluconate 3-dehydrogenase [Chitinasiproducens palmae]|uniref:2-deoxy-D-gluconate 3-dehydrogenase n=1 Tax=Chitinasiproducens palmae TaxID=1770053 RepID=A0A1H2PQ38_9BURK|nr:2-deoxy-D-gluconate 3-dehydrogenase [Chitinasiproducens palmae]